jgi:hypothetical protein
MLAPTVDSMATMAEQTTAFMDANPGRSIGENLSPLDYELADAQTSADLGDFLSRPVRLYSETWTQAQAVGTWIDNRAVWFDYLNQPAIKNKLQNYAFFSRKSEVEDCDKCVALPVWFFASSVSTTAEL